MSTNWEAGFRSTYGPWAVVAGGSDGIGAEFARQLAALGLNLVLVARRSAPLAALADELERQRSVAVHTVSLDLSDRSQIALLLDETAKLEVGLLVCNAALSVIGPFLQQSPEDHERMLDINARTPLVLAHAFARRMISGHGGGIILLSSMASFGGTLHTVHYAATKAYLRVLAEGLWAELRPYGIDVLASCPGTVRTPTFLRDEPVNRKWRSLPVLECGPTVSETLHSLGRRPVVMPGRIDRLVAFFMQRILTRKALIALTARATRAMYPRVVEEAESVSGKDEADGSYRR